MSTVREFWRWGFQLKAWPTWFCALMPAVLFAEVISLVLHVRIGLGHWPRPMIEKFSTPWFDTHEKICFLVALLTIYVAPAIWFLLLFFRGLRLSLRLNLLQFATYGLGWGLIAGFCKWDPWRFVEWMLD